MRPLGLTPFQKLCDRIYKIDPELEKKFRHNVKHHRCTKFHHNICNIVESFVWVKTSEGQSFWYALAKRLGERV